MTIYGTVNLNNLFLVALAHMMNCPRALRGTAGKMKWNGSWGSEELLGVQGYISDLSPNVSAVATDDHTPKLGV